MFDTKLIALASQLVETCRSKGLTVTTAESCTGGLIASLITEVAGASTIFLCGYVTYSNQAKSECLAVPDALIEKNGAVSDAVAAAMARGARTRANAQLAVAVTGIAGPGGGSAEKPVGTVCISVATPDDAITRTFYFTGTRQEIRIQSVEAALGMLLATLPKMVTSVA
jgi:nicotinamide-nucleotide amidase